MFTFRPCISLNDRDIGLMEDKTMSGEAEETKEDVITEVPALEGPKETPAFARRANLAQAPDLSSFNFNAATRRRSSQVQGSRVGLEDQDIAGPQGQGYGRKCKTKRQTRYDDFLKYFTYDQPSRKIEDKPGEEMESEETDEDEELRTKQKKKKKINYGEANGIKFVSEFHALMHRYTESKLFTGFIMFIILINTSMLVAQTWQVVVVRATWYFAALDNMFLGIYIMEVVIKMYVWRSSFFKEGWNILDFTIVVFNIIDFSLPLVLQNVGGFNLAAIFRLLRVFRAVKAVRTLRVMRTIRFLANLHVIMTTLLQSIRSIGAIVMLITLTMYMFAVIGRGLYSELDKEHFGSLLRAIFTLFQLLTLDDWFEIYQKISANGRESIIVYLMLYIVVEYLIFLNLFVAVLVDNFQLSLEAANEAAKQKSKNQEDSDDEEDLYGLEVEAKSNSTVLSDAIPVKKTLEDYYPGHADEDLDTMRRNFQLMTSLEHNYMILNRQQRILDMMVDICADANDDI